MLHLPSLPSSSGKFPAVVLFHGFTGTRVEAHRLFVNTSRELAAHGLIALRFDFRGCGDSDGDFFEMNVGTEVSDGLAALSFLVKHPQVDPAHLGILGLSLGGAVGILVTARLSSDLAAGKPLQSLALWSAPAAGDDIIKIRTNPVAVESLLQAGVADYNGNPVSKTFLDEFEKLVPADSLGKSECPLLIVHGQNDLSVPLSHADRLEVAATKPGRRVEKHVILGADHTFNRLDWEREIISTTVNWFAETLR